MSSIAYNGHSFGDYLSAKLVEPVAHVIVPKTAKVPGRPGRVLLSADMEPLELRVRLFLDAPDALTTAQRSEVRRTLRSWLLSTDGATLKVPGEPNLEWRDALCAGVSDWSCLFSDGSATATFLALDPIAYGSLHANRTAAFTVTGSWPTLPTFELRASAGNSTKVTYVQTGKYVELGRAFSAGDGVVVDCASQAVAVNGADASEAVTLGSDFFRLWPGSASLSFSGCSSHSVYWNERWI